jgi:serpin B
MVLVPVRRTIAVVLVGCTLMAACGGDDDDAGDGGGGGKGGVEVVKAELTRAKAPTDAPVDQVVAGLRDFAVKLGQTDGGSDNLVVSPTSIAVAFAMAEAGAGSQTAADIAKVFGFPNQPAVHDAMNALTAQIEAANHKGRDGSEGVKVDLANAVWGQKGRQYGQGFLDTLARDYGSGLRGVDFAKASEAARKAINQWVADATHDRIPELLPRGSISPETVIALVNAIYLKASWAEQFTKEATSDQPFTSGSGSKASVPTMHDSMLHTAAHVGDGYSAVKLPYDGNDLSMVVIVPDTGTSLADFEKGLTGDKLAGILSGLQPATVDLSLPKFEATSALDLAQPLSALGLSIPGGDLSGITKDATIGAAVHAANITVDEKGTEAAAATAVIGVTSAPAPGDIVTIKVDRPFLFLIQHDATGAPLFYGRITNPRG